LYFVAPGALLGVFRPREADEAAALVTIGTTMLMMSALWQLFDAIGMTLGEALRAAGDTTWTMLARIVLAWLVFAPLAYLTVITLGGGVVALMASLVAYLGLIAAALAYRFRSGRWRQIELVKVESEIV